MYQTTAQAENNKGLTSHKPAPQINLRYENTLRIEQRYKTLCEYPGVSSCLHSEFLSLLIWYLLRFQYIQSILSYLQYGYCRL